METTQKLIEPLMKKVEAYSCTTTELFKLKMIDKSSTILSDLMARIIYASILLLFFISLGLAFSLWLGELLGKNYYGFAIVSGFYGVLSLIVFYLKPMIQSSFKNLIIAKSLK